MHVRRRGVVVLVACLVLAAVVAVVVRYVVDGGSGSNTVTNVGGNDDERSPFALRAAAICQESFGKRGKLVAPTGPREIARVSTALVPVYDYRLRELSKLAPLAQRPKIYRAWLVQIHKARAHLIAAGRAGRRGNRKDADFELRLFSGAQATSEFLAEQLGVEGCAEQE